MIEYTQIELRIMALFSALGAAFSFLVGGVDKLITALLVFVVLDYVTGLIAAWKTAALDSKKGFDGIKRKVVDEMFQHIEDKEDLMGVLLEMFMDASKSLLATDTEDKTAKNATWEIV